MDDTLSGGEHVTLSLPSSWETTQPPQGVKFYAQSPDAYANAVLYVQP